MPKTSDERYEAHKKRLSSDPQYANEWDIIAKACMAALCEGILEEGKQIIKEQYGK